MPDSVPHTEPRFYIYEKCVGPYLNAFGLVAALTAVSSLIFGLIYPDKTCHPLIKHWILAIWTLGVPLWFSIEYWFIYRKWGIPNNLEFFKHSQDLTAKVWLAVLAILVFLYTGAFKLGE